jgi:hypothetical protein
MKTYLIFFGKSQDFIFYAFDESNRINNFDTVIKDFDKLESEVLTVDEDAREEILSKYIFEKDGKFYSLLKLYSLAQANQGARIAGSIYGVALLSEGRDIKISKNNIDILTGSKDKFAKASLDGLKFNKTNFYDDVKEVWKALINHKKGNLLAGIEFNNFGSELAFRELKTVAFYVNDILNDSISLNDEILNANQLYFSSNINHLKRTKGKYRNVNTFMFYDKRKSDPDTSSEKRGTTSAVQDELAISKEQACLKIKKLTKELRNVNKTKLKAQRQLKIVFLMACFFLITTGLFFFYPSPFIDTYMIAMPDSTNSNVLSEDITILDDSTLRPNINYILEDSLKRKTLKDLIINVKCFLEICEIQDCRYKEDIKKHKEKALDDLETLELNPEFIDSTPVSYTPRANIDYILTSCEKLESLEGLIRLIKETNDSQPKIQELLEELNLDENSVRSKTSNHTNNQNNTPQKSGSVTLNVTKK